ncbi:MAG: pilin [bacterium]|nr:pilin [bacterium]
MRRVFKIIIVSVCLLLISQFAIAQGLVPSGCQTGCPCTLCDLYELARNFINFLLFVLAIPIGALMFLYGGVTLLTSQGNPNKLTQGKTVLVNAVIGLAIAFFAYVIIGALLSTLAFEISFGGALRQWYQPPSCELRSGGGTCTTEFPPPPVGGGVNPLIPTCGNGTCEPPENDLVGSPLFCADCVTGGGLTSDAIVRGILATAGISVNKGCVDVNVRYQDIPGGQTCVEGLPPNATNKLIEIQGNCSSGNCVTVTGGTEAGHVSHGPGRAIVDLRYSDETIQALSASGVAPANFGTGFTCETASGSAVPCVPSNSGIITHIHVEF